MLTKQLFRSAVLAGILTSCQSASEDTRQALEKADTLQNAEVIAQETTDTATVAPDSSGATVGFYVGAFTASQYEAEKEPMLSNKINLSIDSVVRDKVFGHSVVAGNITPFTGKILNKADGLKIEAKENGTGKYNGVFNFTCYPNLEEVAGTWVANDKSLAVTEREYRLKKKTFRYDASREIGKDVYGEVYNSYDDKKDQIEFITADAGKFNASLTELKAEDVENMFKRDLEVMRNTIYARHGYSFKNRQVRSFFDDQVEWYIPMYTDVANQLTPLEKKNIALLKRYEEHAQAYYDSYGR